MNHYDCNGPCSLGCTWNALQPSQLYPLPPAEQCSELWLRKCAGFARAAALRLAQTGGLGRGQPRLPRRTRLPWAGPCPPAPLWWGSSVLAVLGMCSPRAPKLARVCGLCPDSSGAACDRVLPRLGPARLGAVRREPWDSSHLCFSPSSPGCLWALSSSPRCPAQRLDKWQPGGPRRTAEQGVMDGWGAARTDRRKAGRGNGSLAACAAPRGRAGGRWVWPALPSAAAVRPAHSVPEPQSEQHRVPAARPAMPNFAGTWKMRSSENFDELLKALGELGTAGGLGQRTDGRGAGQPEQRGARCPREGSGLRHGEVCEPCSGIAGAGRVRSAPHL